MARKKAASETPAEKPESKRGRPKKDAVQDHVRAKRITIYDPENPDCYVHVEAAGGEVVFRLCGPTPNEEIALRVGRGGSGFSVQAADGHQQFFRLSDVVEFAGAQGLTSPSLTPSPDAPPQQPEQDAPGTPNPAPPQQEGGQPQQGESP